jgi:predicted nucleic acid-binding Zn ribbon protein
MDPLHSVLPSVLSDLLKKGPISPAKLELAWHVAVGDALARVTQVRLETSSVLVVAVADERWQRELKRSTKMILGRLRSLLGDSAITRLEVTGPSTGRASTTDKIWTPSSS